MATEQELYNSYIALMDSTSIRVNTKINKALKTFSSEIKNSNERFDTIYKRFANHAELKEDLAVTLRASLLQQTAIGYNMIPSVGVSVVEAQASVKTMVDIYVKRKGIELSENIYSSIDNTQKEILSSLKQAHNEKLGFNKTVKKLEGVLDKRVAKQDQLAKYMRDIEKKGKRLIDSKDEKAIREFKKSVKNAQSQIDNLVDSKPFKKQQQAALKKAVRAVEKNSLDKLDEAIEKGVSTKYKSNMRRLVVTENGTVYEQAMYNERYDDPLITAVKFTLSSSHDFFDQCNVLAETDFYGLGIGVYPIANQPALVIHPNGVSYMVSVPKRKVSQAQINSAPKVTNKDLVKAGKKMKGIKNNHLKALEKIEKQKRTIADKEKLKAIVK